MTKDLADQYGGSLIAETLYFKCRNFVVISEGTPESTTIMIDGKSPTRYTIEQLQITVDLAEPDKTIQIWCKIDPHSPHKPWESTYTTPGEIVIDEDK